MLKRFILLGLLLMAASCKNESKPEWAAVNEKVIKEYNVEGRTRTDIPDTGIMPNLKAGKVENIKDLPTIDLADGVTAKAYWGKGALMSFITFEPNASLPETTIQGERFLFVLKGKVQEIVKGEHVPLKASPREMPGAILSKTPVNEFVYLQDGARTAVKAGSKGAEVLEVYSPMAIEYLKKSGYKTIPDPIDITQFPLAPSVEAQKIYDLNDVQYAELVPGANARIISGQGIQMSFIRMDPGSTFAHHIHPEEQTMIGLRGWIDEIILDTIVRMGKGDMVDFPGGFVHGGNLGPFGCDALDVFFPPRTDYDAYRTKRQKGYNAIIPENAEVKLVVDGSATEPGLTFTEGPAWLDGKLYFSNMYFDKDWNGDPSRSSLVEMNTDGKYRNISENKMQTNGIIPTEDGRLIVCDMFGHRIVEMDIRGRILRVLADSYDGKPLDGPNDLVMDSKGGIYFTDPQFTADKMKNQPGRTAYYLSPKGKLTRILEPDSFAMPNGIILSPDGKTLYINNTHDDEKTWNVDSDKDNFVWAYDVNADGSITNGRKFAELYLTAAVLDRKEKTSGADGMAMDELGNLYVATYKGVQIFDSTGDFVGIINLPDYPVNLTFGGPDLKTLYITSQDKIYSVDTNVKGFSLIK